KAGYVCVSVEYWKGTKERWPTNLQDCKNAVRWLRVNAARLQVDPARIGVIGGSAGGHLALMVAYTPGNREIDPNPLYPGIPDHVSACVDMYGISNLLTRQGTDDSGKPDGKLRDTKLFPESREAAPEKWKLASPVTHIRRDSPPTLILHGTHDTTVDRGQSAELHEALTRAGVESTLIMVKGANHAWPLKTSKFDHTGDVVRFFDRHLKPRP
ncbi:MAG: alpha/beta hydrolase fold domain-containing protein, partial [Luteolibacter sp.]